MSEANHTKKLAIIDGKSVFYRGYYAMSNLATKDGTPTGGVYGFATMALEVLRRIKPDYVCVAWDKPKTNIRKRLGIYPAYKAGRKPAPPDFYEQVPILRELLAAFGWPLYELDDYEADDIMGTLAAQASAQGIDTMLITSDMDMLQVVGEKVHVWILKTGLSNIELYSPKSFEAKYGIKVNQFLDMKSLKGDSSDNIPGVPGIGEKTAIELLKQYKTLDGVYENVALIKDAWARKLVAGKESAYMSKQLASIWTDAPLKLNLTEVDGSNCQPDKILELLEKLEFKSLARRLPEVMQVSISEHNEKNGNGYLNKPKVELIDSAAKLATVNLDKTAPLVVYGRSGGARGQKPLVLLISDNNRRTLALDLTQLDVSQVADLVAGSKLVGYNLKSILQMLDQMGLEKWPAVEHDVLISSFLLNSLRRELSLPALAADILSYEAPDFSNMSEQDILLNAAEVMAVLRGLYDKLNTKLTQNNKLANLAKQIEWPIIPVLADMELAGIQLDTKQLAVMAESIDNTISDLEQQIYGMADQEFTIGSPQQLAHVLFDSLGLPTTGIKKGKTGYSTASSELDKLRGQHEIINKISAWREVTKLKNTYVDTLPGMVDENSRLHTTFNLTVAQTGRLSSTNPNLQNIPIRSEVGRKIRTAFVAGPGNKLVNADYSQFELRLAAAASGDKELIEMFNNNADVHTATAAQVYGRDPEDVTKQMRSAAKAVNFGIIYGQGPHGLTQTTGMSYAQAKDFIEKYRQLRRPLFDYMESIKQFARDNGYVETLLGRRRPMPDIKSSNFAVRSAAERAAINLPIQGTEADIMKLAMVKIDQALKAQHNNCKMLLQIHDSVLVECPEDVADNVAKILKEIMESAYELPVKLTVDTAVGNNWGEL